MSKFEEFKEAMNKPVFGEHEQAGMVFVVFTVLFFSLAVVEIEIMHLENRLDAVMQVSPLQSEEE